MAGTVQARSPHFVLHFCSFDATPPPQSPAPGSTVFDKGLALERPAVGALVPKRWAKRAVTRNTIKRQIYHVSLLFEPQLAPGAHVVRLRSAFVLFFAAHMFACFFFFISKVGRRRRRLSLLLCCS